MIATLSPFRDPIVERVRFSRLLVSRRDPDSRSYRSVGFLSVSDDDRYRFSYLRRHADDPSNRPLPGLPVYGATYESSQLFAIFAERVMSPRRPDRPVVLDALGLAGDAEPFEVLARSGGRRVGDTIELVPIPDPQPDGGSSVDYFVHGVRYMSPESQRRIDELRPGDVLSLVSDQDNPVNARAVMVIDGIEFPLGYVPDPLLELIHSLMEPHTEVLRTNRAELGFHFRVLVRTSGLIRPGARPFEGPDWETVDQPLSRARPVS